MLRRITDRMLTERRAIEDFVPTIVKGTTDTKMIARQIHGVIAYALEKEDDLELALSKLDQHLQSNPSIIVSGDNVDGWRERKRYLTDTQREAIKAMVRIVYTCGGSFGLPDTD